MHVNLCLHNVLQVGEMSLPVDEKLIKNIYELVVEGVHQVIGDSPLPGRSILLFSLNQSIFD